MTEPTPSPSSDEDAVKVVTDALGAFPSDTIGLTETSQIAVAALRRAGWANKEPLVKWYYATVKAWEERDSARSLLTRLEEALKLYRLRHMYMYSGTDVAGGPDCTCGCCEAGRAAFAAVAQARKEGGW